MCTYFSIGVIDFPNSSTGLSAFNVEMFHLLYHKGTEKGTSVDSEQSIFEQ